jgi:hypothetical protein
MRSTTSGRPPSSPVPRSPSRPSGTPWGGRDARSDARASEEIRENRKPRLDGSRSTATSSASSKKRLG